VPPFVTHQRLVGVRPLTPEECDLLEFVGPLVLSRREYRFVLGPWRRADEYVVRHRLHGVMLDVSGDELRRLGVDPDRPTPSA
jgi:hypothetical protein